MILILFSTIFLLPVLSGLGKIMEQFFGILFPGIAGKILLGIMGISLVWTVISFFTALNIYVEISTVVLGLLYFFKEKIYQEFYIYPKHDYLLAAFISGIILFTGAYYPYILDHFGYYVPTIKWLTEYGLVKGISNLDLTLGQMSIWHIFQAGFSNFSDPFLRFNSVLLIVYILYTIENKNWIHLCFIPFLLLFSQSPSPDLPVILFSLIILNEIVSGNKNISLLFAFSVFVFAIKPTMIWLPIMVFLYNIYISNPNVKKLFFGVSILFLFFIKNIWTFGYPIFPVSIGDFGFDWKPNPEVLKTSSQYAILKTYDMQYSYEEIQSFSAWDYIKNWFLLDGIKSKINFTLILSLIIFSVFALKKKKKLISLICISLVIKSIFVLTFSAQYRFFIDVFFVIFFILFHEYWDKKRSVVFFSACSLFIISLLSFPKFIQQYIPSFQLGNFMAGFQEKQLYKPSVYQYHQFDRFKIGNLNFNVSKNYPYNFETPLPAISASFIFDDVKVGIFPQLIDKNNIKKGFTWKIMTYEEKKKAERVINGIENNHQ